MLARLAFCAVFATLSYVGFAPGALGPSYGSVDVSAPFQPTARLHQQGDTLILTGSVSHIFSAGSFAGPNRVEKQDRSRISVDIAGFADAFAPARTEIAALRDAPRQRAAARMYDQLAEAGLTKEPGPVQVAALGRQAGTPDGSAALAAISSVAPDQVGPDQVVPMPVAPSIRLAYGRDTTPITEFGNFASTKYSAREMQCLATAVYFEARGEAYRGQVGVAQVVLNRTKHRLYPDTICGVVYQNQHKRNACQFSFACDGIPDTVNDKTAWAQAEEVATKVTSGELYLSEVADATHYHATYVYPHWAPRMTKMTKIGLHVFYRFKQNWKFG